MKNLFALLAAAFWGTLVASAQNYVVVGDFNHDGKVTVGDLTTLVKAVNDNESGSTEIDKDEADINKDGQLSVDDIYALADAALEQDAGDSHEYVDLNLTSGTLWATCNVGADRPELAGDYFAWGETEPKTNYYWPTYKYIKKGYTDWKGISKYTYDDDYNRRNSCWYNSYGEFIGDNKMVLEPIDDAATQNWSEDWRTPTLEEMKELVNECTWTWTTLNDVKGYQVQSKSNGKSIFLPLTGYKAQTSWVNESYGHYWVSTIGPGWVARGWTLDFNEYNKGSNYDLRCFGHCVRPVRVSTK